ncbi:MAG: hypothetical protein N3E47_01705 [Candidatus Bathyarchaeota archaeon]|nr:hypothetical protein [Candidatus Bathyarchaeota archaeon]
MSANKLNHRRIIINLLIGGMINFGALIFLDLTVYSMMDWIYRSLGIYGVLIYEEARNAYYLIRLGTVFLSSGFIGGLYVGYKIKENLKLIMAFPSPTGLSLVILLQFLLGNRAILTQNVFELVKIFVIPLVISLLGSYLGGYTLNWHVEKKPKEERISFTFS